MDSTEVRRPTAFFDAYLFDLDGTIYLGDDLLPGAERLIDELRRRRIPVRFLSNNPTKDPLQYAEKLARLGLPTDVSDIANTVATMTRWLVANHPDAVVFPIAEQPLIDSFREAGITMSEDPAEIDIVVASYDRGFDYRKLQIAFDAIWYHDRAILVATNPDRYCPFPGGRGEPDCAAIVAAIEACTGTTCVQTVGKPDPSMLFGSAARPRRRSRPLRDGGRSTGHGHPNDRARGDVLGTAAHRGLDARRYRRRSRAGPTRVRHRTHRPTPARRRVGGTRLGGRRMRLDLEDQNPDENASMTPLERALLAADETRAIEFGPGVVHRTGGLFADLFPAGRLWSSPTRTPSRPPEML